MPDLHDSAPTPTPAAVPAARRAWWTLARVQVPGLLAAAAVLGILGFGGPPAAGVLVLRLELGPDGRWGSPAEPGRTGLAGTPGVAETVGGSIDASIAVIWTAGPGWATLRAGEPKVHGELVAMPDGTIGSLPPYRELYTWWAERLEAGDEDATAGTRLARPAADQALLLRAMAAACPPDQGGNAARVVAARGAAARITLQSASLLCVPAAAGAALAALTRKLAGGASTPPDAP